MEKNENTETGKKDTFTSNSWMDNAILYYSLSLKTMKFNQTLRIKDNLCIKRWENYQKCATTVNFRTNPIATMGSR